jgi:hypothetical protein
MTTKETAVNYTPEMVARLHSAAPIDYAKAQSLAIELGKGVRSIIAKVKREEIEYISKPAPAKKKPQGASKADIVGSIASTVGVGADELTGLEKATGSSLGKLLAALQV